MQLDMVVQMMKVPFVSQLVSILGGLDSGVFNFTGFAAFSFVHPLILAVSWAIITMPITRVLTGEIENGTADLLLTLPVSRFTVYTSSTAFIFLICPLLPLGEWLGLWIGSYTVDLPEPIDFAVLLPIVVNAAAMLFAITGIASLVSAASERRGKAAGVLFGILIVSFLLNWLVRVWPESAPIARLSILRYFRPFVLIADGGLDYSDLATLLSLGIVTWIAGAVIFTRKDIHAA